MDNFQRATGVQKQPEGSFHTAWTRISALPGAAVGGTQGSPRWPTGHVKPSTRPWQRGEQPWDQDLTPPGQTVPPPLDKLRVLLVLFEKTGMSYSWGY